MNIYFILLVMCLTPFVIKGEVIESAHIADVAKFIDAKTWVLVDLDNTLFEASQAIGHVNWYYDEIVKLLQNGMSKEEAVNKFYPEWLKVQETGAIQVIEDEFIPLMILLQQQGIVVMGLTHRLPIAAQTTIRQINSIGFDFTPTAPTQETFSLEAKYPTLYLQGVLFVNDFNSKGDVFTSFLSKIGKRPEKVVFIDDKKANVEDLEKSLQQLNVDYMGIYYTAQTEKAPIYSQEKAEKERKVMEALR